MKRLFLTLSTTDGAIGSRWIPGATLKVRQSIMRQLESRAFNLIIRILFGIRYHDTQCGAKAFKKSAIDAVLPKMVSRGFEFDVELDSQLLKYPLNGRTRGTPGLRREI